jgi:hypothetical protein
MVYNLHFAQRQILPYRQDRRLVLHAVRRGKMKESEGRLAKSGPVSERSTARATSEKIKVTFKKKS